MAENFLYPWCPLRYAERYQNFINAKSEPCNRPGGAMFKKQRLMVYWLIKLSG